MITLRRTEASIVGTVNGKPFNVAKTESTWKTLQDFQNNPKTTTKEVLEWVDSIRDQEIAGANKYLIFKPSTKEYFLQLGKKRSTHPLPKAVVAYIEESFDKEIDFMPVIKAWARLLANPLYTPDMGKYFSDYLNSTFTYSKLVKKLMTVEGGSYSKEAAKELATYRDIAITQEGLLATYKVARMVTWEYVMVLNEKTNEWEKEKNPAYEVVPAVIDAVTGEILEAQKIVKPAHLEDFLFTPAICTSGDRFYSGKKLGYEYQVGKIQKLPKNAKRNLNNTFGGGGLYIGGLRYIENYRGEGNHVLTCLVNPGDIISFQDQGSAIRVNALFPNNVWDEEDSSLSGLYHSSEYAKLSSARLDALVAEAIANDMCLIEETKAINKRRTEGEELQEDSNE